jgi:hypothetical protein
VVRLGRPANIQSTLWNYTLDALIQKTYKYAECKQILDNAVDKYDQLVLKFNNSQTATSVQSPTTSSSSSSETVSSATDSVVTGLGASSSSYGSGNNTILGTALSYARKDIHSAKQMIKEREEEFAEEVLLQADVVVCTCVGAGSETLKNFVKRYGIDYEIVLIDEAAQVIHIYVLLSILITFVVYYLLFYFFYLVYVMEM